MNFNDSKSIYQQIATRICDEIMLGVYEEGNRIPSVRDYAVRSYGYLEQLGIIESKRGLGYFVTPDSREIITEARKKEFFESFVPDFFKHMDMLGIDFGDIEKLYAEYKNNKEQEK